MSKAQQQLAGLMSQQLEALARTIAAQYPSVDAEAALAIATNQSQKLDLPSLSKTRRRKSTKSKGPLAPEEQCVARVWRTGSGKDQCGLRKGEHNGFSCYCKRHAKQASITEEPCTRGDAGYSHTGLWFGRIDQALPWLDKDGVIAIEWNTPEHKEQVNNAIQSGTARRHVKAKTYKGAKKKSTKKKKLVLPSTPSTVEADGLVTLSASTNETKSPSISELSTSLVSDVLELGQKKVEEKEEEVHTAHILATADEDEEVEELDIGTVVNSSSAPQDDVDALLENLGLEEDEVAETVVDEDDDEEEEEVEGGYITDLNDREWFVEDGTNAAYDPKTGTCAGTWNPETKMVEE